MSQYEPLADDPSVRDSRSSYILISTLGADIIDSVDKSPGAGGRVSENNKLKSVYYLS